MAASKASCSLSIFVLSFWFVFLDYGCEIWGDDLVAQNGLDKLKNSWCNAVLHLKDNPAVGLRAGMGLSPLQIRRRGRQLGYWRKLCMAQESRLLSLIFRERHAKVVAGTATQSCLVAFKRVLEMHGFAELWTERCYG